MNKKLMVFIVLLLLIIPSIKTYALSDSFYEAEYIPGEYIKKFRGDSGKYEQLRFFRRTSDNQPVYCIELWETLSSYKNLTGYDTNQYDKANISYHTWERIMLIAYYGYGYENHTDSKWYAITQYMIWKETSPDTNLYFTDTLNGKKITKYEEEMNEINELIQKYLKLPSFNNANYELRYNESITIEDTNHVLEQFEITYDGGAELIKEGDFLTIKTKEVGKSKLYFANDGKRFETAPIIYVDPTGQDVLAAGKHYPIYMIVTLNMPTSSITINKWDKDNQNNIPQGEAKLSGSKFQLLDMENQVVAEKEIDRNGILTFENIGYGNYNLKEIFPGEGYVLNHEILPINVNEKIKNITFYNQVIKNKISFQKYLKNPLTGKIKQEEGATFSIYNKDNQKIKTFTTDNNGYYELELPYGHYIIRQDSGTKNHYHIEEFEFQITEDGLIQNFDMYNEELTANIKVINTDFDSNLPLLESGATFRIKNLDTNQYILDQNNNILLLETNDFGNTSVLKLSSGRYQIEQIDAIYGYLVNDHVFDFEISDDSEFLLDKNNQKYVEITVPNRKQKSRIEIEKYIEYYLDDELQKKEKDDSIIITIYAKEDIYSKDGIKIYEKDEEIEKVKYKNGKMMTSPLVFGTYYLQNPINNKQVELVLDSIQNKKVELLEQVFEYTEKIPETDPEDNNPKDNTQEQIPEEKKDIEDIPDIKDENSMEIIVPNTLNDEKFSINKLGILMIFLGLLFWKKEKKYEKKN